ncbi:DUF4127 family protein [Bacillus sp. PS06]|uniref:DUF4127 family protein n=1 Tax=Bacillus sp. PS06 TaxID=2764176 RepID=UPI00177CB083|nr:DUF4127 family protein [Bacillus sp. PS06]MBD8067461.1 DUF4127 family protein [Bacillus sp. PS06]
MKRILAGVTGLIIFGYSIHTGMTYSPEGSDEGATTSILIKTDNQEYQDEWHTPFVKGKTVMLIPLDNRPVNQYVPEQIAGSGAINLMTPPAWMLGDLQHSGMSDEIMTWLVKHADQVDAFIISADMLVYGGLVASRSNESINQEEALERLKVIEEIKKTHPETPIYVFDTILRQTITTKSESQIDDYHQVAKWGQLYDRVYRKGEQSLEKELKQLEKEIPGKILDSYIKARERNFVINQKLIDLVSYGIIDFLLFGQDDASGYGLHQLEQERLTDEVEKRELEEKIMMLAGADELDVLLLSRYYNVLYHLSPSFYIDYTTVDGPEWTSRYEDIPLKENIQKHVKVINGTITKKEEQAEFHLVVQTNKVDETLPSFNRNAVIQLIKEKLDKQYHVIFVDVVNHKSDSDMFKLLLDNDLLLSMQSYAAWNTPGNTIGLAISHSSIRQVFVRKAYESLTVDDQQETYKYHYQYLLHRYLKDHYYKNHIVSSLRTKLSKTSIDEWNLGESERLVLDYVQKQFENDIKELTPSFMSEIATLPGSKEDLTISIKEIPFIVISSPWNRLFELEIRPNVIINIQ